MKHSRTWPLVTTMVLALTACSGAPTTPASAPATSSPATSAAAPTPTTLTAAQYCPTSPTSVVEPSSTAQDLLAVVEPMTHADDSTLQAAASDFFTTVSAESPAPTLALEAIGRLSWAGKDPELTLRALGDAVSGVCVGASDGSVLAGVGAQLFSTKTAIRVPAKTPTGVITGDDVYGLCPESAVVGFTHPFTMISTCSGGVVLAVDLATGALISNKAALPAEHNDVTLFGDALLAYSTIDVTPASGLSDASWTETLHVIDLDGNQVSSRAVGKGPGDGSSARKVYAAATSDATGAVAEYDSGGKGWTLGLDAAGKPTWNAAMSVGQPSVATLSTAGGSKALIDVRSGRTLATTGKYLGDGRVVTNACLTGAQWADQGFNSQWVTVTEPSPGKVTVYRAPPPQNLRNYQSAITSQGVVVEWDGDSKLHGWSARTGKKVWDLQADVSPQWSPDSDGTVGDYGLVTNGASEAVLVNLNTGREATGLDETTATALKHLGGRYRGLVVSPATDDLVLYGSSGELVHLSWKAVCTLAA